MELSQGLREVVFTRHKANVLPKNVSMAIILFLMRVLHSGPRTWTNVEFSKLNPRKLS